MRMKRFHFRDIGQFLLGLVALIVLFAGLFLITKLFVSNFSPNHKEWIGSFYSDNSQSVAGSKEFDEYEDCTSWGNELVAKQPAGNAYFTCGRDCEFQEDTIRSGKRISTYVCNELIKSTDK